MMLCMLHSCVFGDLQVLDTRRRPSACGGAEPVSTPDGSSQRGRPGEWKPSSLLLRYLGVGKVKENRMPKGYLGVRDEAGGD